MSDLGPAGSLAAETLSGPGARWGPQAGGRLGLRPRVSGLVCPPGRVSGAAGPGPERSSTGKQWFPSPLAPGVPPPLLWGPLQGRGFQDNVDSGKGSSGYCWLSRTGTFKTPTGTLVSAARSKQRRGWQEVRRREKERKNLGGEAEGRTEM